MCNRKVCENLEFIFLFAEIFIFVIFNLNFKLVIIIIFPFDSSVACAKGKELRKTLILSGFLFVLYKCGTLLINASYLLWVQLQEDITTRHQTPRVRRVSRNSINLSSEFGEGKPPFCYCYYHHQQQQQHQQHHHHLYCYFCRCCCSSCCCYY